MRGYIVKRGKKFAAVVYLGIDPATKKERRKWYTHGTRREAEAHLAHVVSQVQAGFAPPSTKVCVSEYLSDWLRDYTKGAVGPVTHATYQGIIDTHLVPALGHIPLARLAPQAIQGYLSRKLQAGLSPTTVLHHHRVLHEALRHAVRWGLLSRNPSDLVDPPRPSRPEMRVLDDEQVRLFLAQAKRTSPYYALYLAAVTTGMRQGELLGLRWQDVDFLTGRAVIQQTFYRLAGQPIFKAPKTHRSRRPVPLSPVLVEELRALRDRQNEHRRLLGAEYDDHGLVFCQTNGRPLHAHNITQRDFRTILEDADLPRIRFHDLRHSHATLLLQQGTHPKVVQERLGHATPAFTLAVYSHVLPGMQEEAVSGLEARLFGTKALSR